MVTVRKKMPKIKIFNHFLSSNPLIISGQNLVAPNMSHLLKIIFQKITYNRRTKTLSKAASFSFLNFPYSSSFKFFGAVLSILKRTSFNLSEDTQHDKYVAFK